MLTAEKKRKNIVEDFMAFGFNLFYLIIVVQRWMPLTPKALHMLEGILQKSLFAGLLWAILLVK